MTCIRLALEKDVHGILDIYAPYIEKTSYTFETEVPTKEEFSKRISNNLLNWPWLVCEVNGIIAGYAYATRHRERNAYQWCVESSVYVHNDFQRTGIAGALYSALFSILQKQGFRNVYAVINLPNEKSVAFHERYGFHYFATYEKIGYKLGEWKNVGWWKLSLNEYNSEPAPPVKFSDMNKSFLPAVLNKAEASLKI